MRKHADFAMYQVKKTEKGKIAEFNQDIYEEEFRDSQIRREFHRFVEEELVTYYFQPIVSAKTGEIEAYEALMRSELPILKNPDVVMKIAREEGALREIIPRDTGIQRTERKESDQGRCTSLCKFHCEPAYGQRRRGRICTAF